MTAEELTQWMRQPQKLGKEQIPELKELCEKFPYFSVSKMLLSKALQNTNDLLFDTEVKKTATGCNDLRKLYFLLHPQNMAGKSAIPNSLLSDLSGEYFSIHQVDESKEQSQSLKSLAQKLKEARIQKIKEEIAHETSTEMQVKATTAIPASAETTVEPKIAPTKLSATPIQVQAEPHAETTATPLANAVSANNQLNYTEAEAIRRIKEKDFENALKILRVLHLNIPEKSVYFADQIRYLEKIIATINKS